MIDVVADVSNANRVVGTSGNLEVVAELVAAVGPRLLDRVGVKPGIDLLDVGTGSGSAVAIPAARLGANVTGSDSTPELFNSARRRAAAAGVEVVWVEADAENLPFADARFDRVLSTFGHIFAPRHADSAAEMARVLRPGGMLAVATWTPDGLVGDLLRAVGTYVPPPPSLATPPADWGDQRHVREMFEPHGIELDFFRDTIGMQVDSVEGLVTLYEQNFEPVVTAKRLLGDRWPELRAELTALFSHWNRADLGPVAIDAEYLVTIGRKPES